MPQLMGVRKLLLGSRWRIGRTIPLNWKRHALAVLITTAGILACAGCERGGPTVVLYVSADEHIARQIIHDFEQRSGIRVLMVGDTEAKKTTGLVERLRSEKSKPQADVYWSSEVFMTIDLANEDLFEPHQSTTTESWPTAYRDPQHRWYGFAARPRVIVYSPDRVVPDDVPTTWMDLTRDQFKDRVVMADPRFGTTGGHLGAMKAYWDREVMPGYFAGFVEGLAANQVRMLPSGNAGVVDAVARGEADIGMTDADDVWAAQAREMKVQLVYPNHGMEPEGGIGTLLIPNTAARIRNGPNPDHASQLMDYLLSEDVERMLARSVSHNIPVRPSVAAEFPEYAVPDPLKVNLIQAAAARPTAVQQVMRALGSSPPNNPPVDASTSAENNARFMLETIMMQANAAIRVCVHAR